MIPYQIRLGFNKKQYNKYVVFKYNHWKSKHPQGMIVQVIGEVTNLSNFYEYQLYCKSLYASIQNFNKLKSNVFNLGLSSANITKLMLANKIKKYQASLKIKIIKNRKDPDKRDYYVSNKKIEKKGFKAKINLDSGIRELITYFKNNSEKIINNY